MGIEPQSGVLPTDVQVWSYVDSQRISRPWWIWVAERLRWP